jgi:aminoglycoside phosphotransferase (APT) family kinase protein
VTRERKPDVDPRALRDLLARVFSGGVETTISRTTEGTTTQVYRIERAGECFYLRVAEDREDRYAAEALVHDLLIARGVRVPRVVHYEPFDEVLDRSVLITTEIPGRSLAEHHLDIDRGAVLRAAGRDLAVVNDLAVAGFGWIRRDRPAVDGLEADLPTLRAFVQETLTEGLTGLDAFLSTAEVMRVRDTVAAYAARFGAARGNLVHGDFDATHVYHRDGEYTGIIDFGEIRGADRWYDLGHFALHDGERLPAGALSDLLDGYREVAPYPEEDECRIWLWAVLIGMRLLVRTAGRAPATIQARWVEAVRSSVVRISA